MQWVQKNLKEKASLTLSCSKFHLAAATPSIIVRFRFIQVCAQKSLCAAVGTQKLQNLVTISYITMFSGSSQARYRSLLGCCGVCQTVLADKLFSHFRPEHQLKQRIRMNVYFHIWKIEVRPEHVFPAGMFLSAVNNP